MFENPWKIRSFQGCWDVIKVLEQREQLDDPVHAHCQTVVPGKHSTEN